MAELRSTTADLRPISEYELTVHAPTKWDTTQWQEKGTFTVESPFMFMKATTPFHVPQVGHEISVAFDGSDWLGTEAPSPHVFVVTRVSHRIVASQHAITCKLDVYTEATPRPDDTPDELRRGRSGA